MTLKQIIFTLTFVSFSLIFNSCCSWEYSDKDIEFTQNELNCMSSYKVSDTIYFKSNLDNIDTILVLDIYEEKEIGDMCFISKKPSNLRVVTIKHLPLDKWHGKCLNCEEGSKNTFQPLISISKDPLKKNINYSINYREFTTFGNSIFSQVTKNRKINNIIVKNCYKFIHKYPNRINDNSAIKVVYWTNEHGLTAYTNLKDETWVITNLVHR